MNSRTRQRENAARLLLEYPLTQGQAALWFHYKSAPNSVAYDMAGAIVVQEGIDLDEKISIGKIPSGRLLMKHKEVL